MNRPSPDPAQCRRQKGSAPPGRVTQSAGPRSAALTAETLRASQEAFQQWESPVRRGCVKLNGRVPGQGTCIVFVLLMDQCNAGLAAQETPAGLMDVIRRLMHTASLEVVPGDPNSVETLAHLMPPQTRVYITSPAGRPIAAS